MALLFLARLAGGDSGCLSGDIRIVVLQARAKALLLRAPLRVHTVKAR